MTKKEVLFPFEPVPKGRPRFTRMGRAYTPQKTADYEKQIAEYYKKVCGYKFESAIEVTLAFQMPIPKSITKKQRAKIIDGTIKHTKKPDADNLAKAVLDGLNGVAYTDDSLITKLRIAKYYSENPSVWMIIREDIE